MKFFRTIAILFGIAIAAQLAGVSFAAPYPTGLGGTGTVITPSSGQTLIGNGSGSYTPALLAPGTDIVITNASGSVTLAVDSTEFLPSSTVYVATVNGQSGAITITSTTLGVATNTLSLFNGNGFTTTTISSVLHALSAVGLATYSSSTGVFTVSSSSLNLGTAASHPSTDFLASSTVYVASVNGQSGAVTLGIPATTTINGVQSALFRLIGDGTTVTTTLSGSTTTFSIINTGNWAGTWQNVNSSTFYLASNPNGYIIHAPATTTINGTQAASFFLTATGGITSTISGATTTFSLATTSISQFVNDKGYLTGTTATTTINGTAGNAFTFTASSTGNALSITTSTNGFVNFLLQLSSFLTNALTSLNGATSSQQTVVAGNGVSVSTTPGVSNSTTTVTNTGVLSVQSSTQISVSAPTGSNIQLSLISNYLTTALTTLNGFTNATQTITASGVGLSVATTSPNVTTITLASSSYLQPTNNLSDVQSSSSALMNIGAAGTAASNTLTGSNTFNATTTVNGEIDLFAIVGNFGGSTVFANSTSSGDYGAYMNTLCSNATQVASSALIYVPGENVTFSTGIVENTRCTDKGIGGNGTIWNWNGATGTVMAQMAFSPTPHVTGGGFEGITFNNIGSNAATSTTGTIGLLMASSSQAGGAHSIVQYNTFIGFSKGLVVGSGTYDAYINENAFVGNGNSLVFNHANNSGESIRVENNWVVNQYQTSPFDCVLINQGALDSGEFSENVFDACQVHEMDGNTANFSMNKAENSGVGVSYAPFLQDSSTASTLNVFGEKIFNDGTTTSTSFSAVYNLGGTANINGTIVQIGTNASSVPLLFTNAAGSGTADITICGTQNNNNNTAFTAYGPNTAGLAQTSSTSIGCVYQEWNGYLYATTISKTNVVSFWYGGGVYSTVAHVSNVGDNTDSIFTYFGGTSLPSSTVDVGGSFGRKVISFSATTTILQVNTQQAGVYIGSAATTLFLPVATSTPNRDIIVKSINGTLAVTATSTDCFRLTDASATSTGPINLTPAAGSSTIEIVDSGALCGGANSGGVWEEISKQ
jgi:hypothetical protein